MPTFRAQRWAHYRPAILGTRRATAVAAPSITYAVSDLTLYDYFGADGTVDTYDVDASAGGPVASYAVAPAFPAGIALDTVTGRVTITPSAITALAADDTYTITATGTTGLTDTFDITIEVLWAPLSFGTVIAGYDMVAGFSSIKSASDGSGGEAADTEPAGYITDLSGNGNHVIQATVGAKPTVDADGIASKRCITFDGGDFLALATFAGGAETQPNTVACVVLSTAGNGLYLVAGGGAAARSDIFRSTAAGWQYFAGSQLDGAALDQSLHLHVFLANGASSKGYVDDVEGASGDAGAASMNGIVLGARYDGASPMASGSTGAMWVAFAGDIGATARGNLKTWAIAKWGTPV